MYLKIIFFLIFFGLSIFFESQLDIKTQKYRNYKAFTDVDKIKHLHFGYSESLADSIWIQFIQSIGSCHYNVDNSISDRNCNFSPSYFRIRHILELTPKFDTPAIYGGVYLSVIEDDILGASEVYDIALKLYPQNLMLLQTAASHFATEDLRLDQAASLFKKSADLSQNTWLYSLSAKLYSESGRSEIALTMLKDILEKNPNDRFKDRMLKRIKELEDKSNKN